MLPWHPGRASRPACQVVRAASFGRCPMANRIGRYFARGDDCAADIDRAVIDVLFSDSIMFIHVQSGELSNRVQDELLRIEEEAMRVFHHYGIPPPDPLGGTRPAA